MKAIVYTEYGSPAVLHLAEMEQPTPKDNEVLIRVHAASVGYGDIMARDFKHVTRREFNMPLILLPLARVDFGFSKPKKQILGAEFSGVVEAIGSGVTRFKVGDPVFGYRGQSFGGYAEYLCMAEDGLVAHKPANMNLEEAAVAAYGPLTALNVLRSVEIEPGQKVLINGASGGIGSAALQLAKHAGAEVTGASSEKRLAMVEALGADAVIDYRQEDFTQNGRTYDLIFDVLGKSSFSQCKDSLTENGRYLLASFKTKQLWQMLRTKISGSRKVICAMSFEKPEDLTHIAELIEAGAIKSIIDRRFPMTEAAEAHRYVESGQKTGHVVIRMARG